MTPEQRRAQQERIRANKYATGRADAPADKLDSLREHPRSPQAERAQALYKTAEWRIVRARVARRDGGRCSVCTHPKSDSADHDPPVSERDGLDDFFDEKQLFPIHFHPCPTCSIRCSATKGGGSLARARRIVAERIAEALEVEHLEEKQEGAVHPNGKRFTSVSEAMAELSPTLANFHWLWSVAHLLDCDCGPPDEGRCWECLPGNRAWESAVRTGEEPGQW